MSEISLDQINKRVDQLIEQIGRQSFIDWNKFSLSSADVVASIQVMHQKLTIFREYQSRKFLQAMKNLKDMDLPDLILSIKQNRNYFPQAPRIILEKFKLSKGGVIELVEPVSQSKRKAQKYLSDYIKKNDKFLEKINSFSDYLDHRITQLQPIQEHSTYLVPKISPKIPIQMCEEQAEQIAKSINVKLMPGTRYIGLHTYCEIVQKSFPLFEKVCTQITLESRKNSRKIFKQTGFSKYYFEYLFQYLLNTQAVIISAQGFIAEKLGITMDKFEESQLLMMERGIGNHILMLQSKLRDRLKKQLNPTKQLKFEESVQVIKFQIECLKKHKLQIRQAMKDAPIGQQSVQSIPVIIGLMLNDLVYQKYQYEEEDFMPKISEEDAKNNPELVELFKNMEVSILEILQQLDMIPNEIGEFMKRNALERAPINPPLSLQFGQQTQKKLEQQLKKKPITAITPGVNPSDMLQTQQINQMMSIYQQIKTINKSDNLKKAAKKERQKIKPFEPDNVHVKNLFRMFELRSEIEQKKNNQINMEREININRLIDQAIKQGKGKEEKEQQEEDKNEIANEKIENPSKIDQ